MVHDWAVSHDDDLVVVFHTPFATKFLDEKKVTSAQDGAFQQAADYLNSGLRTDGLWRVAKSFQLDLQGYGEPLLSSLRSRMPRPVLETDRAVAIASLQPPHVQAHNHKGPCAFGDTAGTEWTVRSASLGIWSTGAALVTMAYAVTKPQGIGWQEFGQVADDVRATARQDLTPWAREMIGGFEVFSQSAGWVQDWGRPRTTRESFWSEPLWTYQSFILILPPSTRQAELKKTAASLVADGVECPVEERDDCRVIRIGLAAASVTNQRGDRLASKLIRLTDTHTACWASAITLDSFVSDQLLTLQLRERPAEALEEEASQLLRLADKVRFFLTTFEGVSLHLRPEERAIWECLDVEWKFPEHRQGLVAKLDVLRALQGELMSQVGGRALRHLNMLVLALTVIGGLASIVGVYSFLKAADARERVIAGVVLVLGAALWWVINQGRKQRAERR